MDARAQDAEHAGQSRDAYGVGGMRRLSGVSDDGEDLVLTRVEDRQKVEPGSARPRMEVAGLPGTSAHERRSLRRTCLWC